MTDLEILKILQSDLGELFPSEDRKAYLCLLYTSQCAETLLTFYSNTAADRILCRHEECPF